MKRVKKHTTFSMKIGRQFWEDEIDKQHAEFNIALS